MRLQLVKLEGRDIRTSTSLSPSAAKAIELVGISPVS